LPVFIESYEFYLFGSGLFRLGIGCSISKSNLAYANEKRDWQIFADFAYVLIAEARKTILPNEALSAFESNAIMP